MRIGKVVKLLHDRRFGFIRADNLRNDVLFRYSVVKPPARPLQWIVGQEVEFDLDELYRMEHGDLQATVVQPATRPQSHKLDETLAPGMMPAHHPKARRRKPNWRAEESED